MLTVSSSNHILYSITNFSDVRASTNWKEGEKDGENFIWYALNKDGFTVETTYGTFYTNCGVDGKDYIFHPKDYKTDAIVNPDYTDLTFDTFGLISAGPCSIHHRDDYIKNIAYGFTNTRKQFYKVKETVDGVITTTKYKVSIRYDDKEIVPILDKTAKCAVPFIYKKGYADIGVSKSNPENTFQMKLEGYIVGYTLEYDDMQVSIRCEIPNNIRQADTPNIMVNILPHKDIKNVVIKLDTDNDEEKYKDITIPSLTSDITQAFKMIQDVEPKSYYKKEETTTDTSKDDRVIRFSDGDKACIIEPYVEIFGKKISLCKEDETTEDYKSVITLLRKTDRSIKIAGVKAFKENVVLNYCLTIELPNHGRNTINLFMQNAHYSEAPMEITIPVVNWAKSDTILKLLAEHPNYYTFDSEFSTQPVTFILEPGKKSTYIL